jgi:putative membrane protein
LDQALHFDRNHFDRLVHFSFGFLMAYPLEESFRLLACVRGWLLYYLPVMTILGLSGLWEIIESWVARVVHPELGLTYLGSQGDVWDAQKDMAAALYGALLCMILLFLSRRFHRPQSPQELDITRVSS